jgi:hypothetical protein
MNDDLVKINTAEHSAGPRHRQPPTIRVRRRTDGKIEHFLVLVDFGGGEPSILGTFAAIDEALAEAGRARVAWQAKALLLEPGGVAA